MDQHNINIGVSSFKPQEIESIAFAIFIWLLYTIWRERGVWWKGGEFQSYCDSAHCFSWCWTSTKNRVNICTQVTCLFVFSSVYLYFVIWLLIMMLHINYYIAISFESVFLINYSGGPPVCSVFFSHLRPPIYTIPQGIVNLYWNILYVLLHCTQFAVNFLNFSLTASSCWK